MKRLYFIVFFVYFPIISFAQNINADFETYLQQSKIGLVDEFFKRFNGEETHPNFPMKDKKGRKENLLMLLDLSNFKSKEDSLFILASNMLDKVIDDSICIHYCDSSWFAIAHCKGELNKADVLFDVFLKVEHRRDSMYKWSISYVDGDFFQINPQNDNERIMLFPDDHETNFMSLSRMTSEQPFNIRRFMSNGFSYNPTSVFAYLIFSGQLKINYVDKLDFIFTQIPGYVFCVENVERQTGNSGWLITKVERVDSYKDTIINLVLNNNGKDFLSDATVHDDLIDTTKVTSVTLDNSRYIEDVLLVSDYIRYIQSKEFDLAEFYKSKMEELFSPHSNVVIIDRQHNIIDTLSIPDFCSYLNNNKKAKIQIEAITVPIEDSIQRNHEDALKNDDATIAGYTIPIVSSYGTIKILHTPQVLPIKLVHTEEGDEVRTFFGDMVVYTNKLPRK